MSSRFVAGDDRRRRPARHRALNALGMTVSRRQPRRERDQRSRGAERRGAVPRDARRDRRSESSTPTCRVKLTAMGLDVDEELLRHDHARRCSRAHATRDSFVRIDMEGSRIHASGRWTSFDERLVPGYAATSASCCRLPLPHRARTSSTLIARRRACACARARTRSRRQSRTRTRRTSTRTTSSCMRSCCSERQLSRHRDARSER